MEDQRAGRESGDAATRCTEVRRTRRRTPAILCDVVDQGGTKNIKEPVCACWPKYGNSSVRSPASTDVFRLMFLFIWSLFRG